MSFFSRVLKTGLAAKAIDVARREAAKPENQRKIRELASKVTNRGSSGGRGTPPPPSA